MTERPINFNGPMVRAILAGAKSQTRRVVKPSGLCVYDTMTGKEVENIKPVKCPYGQTGDRLWVREQLVRPDGDPWLYAADRMPVVVEKEDETAMIVWAHHKKQDYCPSIHMPRLASRITLEIVSVRVERLQEISEADSKAEGITHADAMAMGDDYPAAFRCLWHTIHAADGAHGWEANPWVWVIEFRRVMP
jgi:hypothetical protein